MEGTVLRDCGAEVRFGGDAEELTVQRRIQRVSQKARTRVDEGSNDLRDSGLEVGGGR